MDQAATGLTKMKRVALAMLLIAAFIFLGTRIFARNSDATWIGYIEATAEAAMVGALADWFAVTALFRRPLGLPIPHTAIIPTRKNEIGESLGAFVQENFLQPEALSARILSAQPSRSVVRWLGVTENKTAVANQVLRGAAAVATVLDADEVSLHLQHAAAELIQTIDVSRALANLADVAMQDGRADALLDVGLSSAIRALETNRDTLRLGFAIRSPWWVPGSVDERVFDRLFGGILDLLREVRRDQRHELRASLLTQAHSLAQRLRTDPIVQQKVASLRDEALSHPSVGRFVRSSWDDMCASLQQSTLQRTSGRWSDRIEYFVGRGADSLAGDAALQLKVDQWLAALVRTLVVDHGHRAAEWIQTTVVAWDPQETANRIELQIGRDLQFVRINGTLVGGLVGLALYTIGQLIG
jgi:uncharacterized membrane-anchored protein YjiN (DUF445 family)